MAGRFRLPARLKSFDRGSGGFREYSSTTKQVRQRRKKKKISEETHTYAHPPNEPPKLTFPFYNGSTSCAQVQYINSSATSNRLNTQVQNNSVTTSQKQLDAFITKEDSIEGRYYLFESLDQEQYRLPSVTNVLQSTLPSNSWFGLHNWRKSMIEEHGEHGYKKMKRDAIRGGTLFHQVC